MKKYLKISLFAVVGCFLFNFCTKYVDGGHYSAHRLCKTWVLTSTEDSDLNISLSDLLKSSASDLEITFVKGSNIKGGGVMGTVKINGVELNKDVNFQTTTQMRDISGNLIGTTSKIIFMEIRTDLSKTEQSWCYFLIKELTNSTLTLDCFFVRNDIPDDGFTTYFVGGQTYKFKAKK